MKMKEPTYKIKDAVCYIGDMGVVLEANKFEHFREHDIKTIDKGVSPAGNMIIDYVTKEPGTAMSSDTRAYCWGYGTPENYLNNSYYKVLIGNKKVIVHESELE